MIISSSDDCRVFQQRNFNGKYIFVLLRAVEKKRKEVKEKASDVSSPSGWFEQLLPLISEMIFLGEKKTNFELAPKSQGFW